MRRSEKNVIKSLLTKAANTATAVLEPLKFIQLTTPSWNRGCRGYTRDPTAEFEKLSAEYTARWMARAIDKVKTLKI